MTTTAEIMQDMEQTRADIRATIGAIEDRVSVEQLVHRVIDPAKAGTIEFGHAFSDAVRANPLALGVTAIGLGWLMLGPQKSVVAITGGNGGRRRPIHRFDPSRLDEPGAAARQVPLGGSTDESPSTSDQIAETFHRAGEKFEQAKTTARDIASDAASRVREAADQGRTRGAETVDQASNKVREVSEAVRQSTSSAYLETRKTAAVVGSRVRDAAGKAGGYVREKPITVGAVLVVGGAALALLLARSTWRRTSGEHDQEPAGMPETPYASGTQATDDGAHRNPTIPLTPEEEGPVFAAGNVSVAAARPAADSNDGTDKVESKQTHHASSAHTFEAVNPQSEERAVPMPSDVSDVDDELHALVAGRSGEDAADRQDGSSNSSRS